MTAFPMLRKECKELWRSYKWLFVPILFAVFAISQPISIKLLPTLLESSTNLPQGTVINIPTPSGSEIVATIISQLNMMGMLILILVSMGAIAGERASGVAQMVLVKPVSRASYFLAKVVSYALLTAFSLFFGMTIAAYYTDILFGNVEWTRTLLGVLTYLPVLLLGIAVTLCGSGFLRSQVAAGGFGLVTMIVLMNVPQYLGEFARSISPGELMNQTVFLLQGKAYEIVMPLIGVWGLIVLFLLIGWLLFKKQEI